MDKVYLLWGNVDEPVFEGVFKTIDNVRKHIAEMGEYTERRNVYDSEGIVFCVEGLWTYHMTTEAVR